MNRALIIGASGFIGQHLVRRLTRLSSYQVGGTYNTRRPQTGDCQWYQVNLTEPGQLEEAFRLAQPDVVVHLAALADVGLCEREPQLATQVNVSGTEQVVRLCSQYPARLLALSTEYVFPGDRGYYQEADPAGPTTHYGRTKWEAEQAVTQHTQSWSVLRTSLVYGWPTSTDRPNLVTRVIDSLSNRRPAYGYTDQFRSPVYVEDLVEGIVKLMEEHYSGVSHVAGPDWVHMGQFVQEVARAFQLDESLVVQTESATEGASGARPSLLGLDSTQTINRLGIQPLDMVSGLRKMQTRRRDIP